MEEKTGITRRNFTKMIGAGTAAAAVAIPAFSGNANAFGFKKKVKDNRPPAPVYQGGQEGFSFISETPFPMRVAESNIVFGKKTAKLYKNTRNLKMDKYIELNAMATVVAELCNGAPHFDEIVNITAEIHNVSRNSIHNKALSFIKYLYTEGYICFVSEKALVTHKKLGSSIVVLDPSEVELSILSRPESNSKLVF